MAEIYRPPDVVIGLGGNVAPFRTQENIKRSDFLAIDSEMTAFAAGLLFRHNYTRKIIFSTGHTSGIENPSEALGMARYSVKTFGLEPSAIILEQNSLDTSTNAKECIRIIKKGGYKNIALLSIGLHATNAAILFHNHGLTIPQKRVWASERVIYHYLCQKSPELAKQFMEDFNDHSFFSGIGLRENIRSLLLATIDPKGDLLHHITKRTRC